MADETLPNNRRIGFTSSSERGDYDVPLPLPQSGLEGEKSSEVEYEEPQFQQELVRGVHPVCTPPTNNVRALASGQAHMNNTAPAISSITEDWYLNPKTKSSSLVLELQGIAGEKDSVKRSGGNCLCGVGILVSVLGLIVMTATALCLGGVALRTKLYGEHDLSHDSEVIISGGEPELLLLQQQLTTLQKQARDLKGLVDGGVVVAALVNVAPVRCQTHTRVCTVGQHPFTCTTDGVTIDTDVSLKHDTMYKKTIMVYSYLLVIVTTSPGYARCFLPHCGVCIYVSLLQEVYPFGINCYVTVNSGSADHQLQSTTGSEMKDRSRDIVVESMMTSDRVYCRCLVRRREQLLLQAREGVQCLLYVTLCPLLLNTTTTDY